MNFLSGSYLLLSALSVLPVVFSQNNSSIPIINVDDEPVGALNTTAWALIYTYPLYIFANFAGSVLNNVGVNQIFHQRSLASPSCGQAVIKPNVDTVYSRVVLDLSQSGLVLTIPNVTDARYYVHPVIDLFGNIIAEIGAVNKNKPGNYLIRRADDVEATPGYQAPNTTSQNLTQYQGVVNLPTTYGTMLIRYLVLQNTTADLNIIQGYQNACHIAALNRTMSSFNLTSPNITSVAPNGTFLGIQTPSEQLTLAAKVQSARELYRALSCCRILGRAGIYNGQYTQPSGVNLTQAAVIANASITADTTNASHVRTYANKWELPIVSYQGNFGTHYASRAYVAIAGYQEQEVDQTLYPGHNGLGFTNVVSSPANSSVLLTFSGKPQLNQYGFWSFTVYGPDQYLIPNSLNRFEVGDRSLNLTYQDGSGLVYGTNANASHDGPFEVLVQPVNFTPPSNWTGNFLPAAQNFTFILRWYVPKPSMTNGSYVYPRFDTIPIIV